jgi:hypothetical protein
MRQRARCRRRSAGRDRRRPAVAHHAAESRRQRIALVQLGQRLSLGVGRGRAAAAQLAHAVIQMLRQLLGDLGFARRRQRERLEPVADLAAPVTHAAPR